MSRRLLLAVSVALLLFIIALYVVLSPRQPNSEARLTPHSDRQEMGQAEQARSMLSGRPSGAEGRTELPSAHVDTDKVECASQESRDADDIDLDVQRLGLAGMKWNGPWLRLDRAELCAKDKEYNPNGIALTSEELRRLQILIDRLNAKLETAQEAIDSIAQSHIQDKINAGQAQALPDGVRPDWNSLGASGLPMGRSSDGVSYYVKFFEGEFSDLDDAMYRQSALSQIAEQRVLGAFH